MANFDNLKRKAKDTAGTIADVSVELYKLAEERAKVLAKTTKLSAEIARDRSQIRKLYKEIGTKYYQAYKDEPADELKQACMEVTAAFERIECKKNQIEEIKASVGKEEAEIIAETDECDCESAEAESAECECGCESGTPAEAE